MSYKEIKEAIDKYHYTLPVTADDEEGHQIVINEGHCVVHDVTDGDIDCHYYITYTYLEDGRVRINKYYEQGGMVETFQ